MSPADRPLEACSSVHLSHRAQVDLRCRKPATNYCTIVTIRTDTYAHVRCIHKLASLLSHYRFHALLAIQLPKLQRLPQNIPPNLTHHLATAMREHRSCTHQQNLLASHSLYWQRMHSFPDQRAVPRFRDQIPPAAGERFVRRQFYSTQLGRPELLPQTVQHHRQILWALLASFLDEQGAQLLLLCHSRCIHSRHQER